MNRGQPQQNRAISDLRDICINPANFRDEEIEAQEEYV